ncbi:hypothetical protein SUGI_0810830 [Cryptomeria japonica]|nr:hypothetical protein SUGI_0810830 [Cryptomeria japonica]
MFRSSFAGSCIVNVSSESGLLQWLNNDSLRLELSDDSKIIEELIDKMLQSFLEDIKGGDIIEKSWPYFFPQYSLSKLALNSYTRLLARKFSTNKDGKMISINNVHPGLVQTNISNNNGDLTASQGVDNVVKVVMFPPNGPSGQFYHMKKIHHF